MDSQTLCKCTCQAHHPVAARTQPEEKVERKALYQAYEEYYSTETETPVNAATLGKLVKKVFPNLKER